MKIYSIAISANWMRRSSVSSSSILTSTHTHTHTRVLFSSSSSSFFPFYCSLCSQFLWLRSLCFWWVFNIYVYFHILAFGSFPVPYFNWGCACTRILLMLFQPHSSVMTHNHKIVKLVSPSSSSPVPQCTFFCVHQFLHHFFIVIVVFWGPREKCTHAHSHNTIKTASHT